MFIKIIGLWLCLTQLFHIRATDDHLDDFLKRASRIDKAWVSPVHGHSSAATGIAAYDAYFADTSEGAAMAAIDLEGVSRRGRVVLFCHILNKNIAKVREGLADGDMLPSASTDATRLVVGSDLNNYFKRGPGTYKYAYWSKKPAKFTYGGLDLELEAHPHSRQHGDCELSVTTGRFSGSHKYPDLIDGWSGDEEKENTAMEQLKRKTKESTPTAGDERFADRINVLRLLCELEIARRYVERPSTVATSVDAKCGDLPFVTLLTMALEPKHLTTSYKAIVPEGLTKDAAREADILGRRQNMRDRLTRTLFDDALTYPTRRRNLLLLAGEPVGNRTAARTRFLTHLVRDRLRDVLDASSDSDTEAEAAMHAAAAAADA